MNGCDRCQRYINSMKRGKPLSCYNLSYYPPGMVRFCRWQMIWLIEWLPVLEEGDWVPDPKETGYTETPHVQRSRSSHGHFETPAQIFSEVTARLGLEKDQWGNWVKKKSGTGDDGITLIWEVQHGLDTYDMLSPPAKMALNYISGWRRRRKSYSKWCYDQRQKKENIPI